MYHTAQDVCASHSRAVYVGRVGEGGGTKYGWKTQKIKGTSDMTKKNLGGSPRSVKGPPLRGGPPLHEVLTDTASEQTFFGHCAVK